MVLAVSAAAAARETRKEVIEVISSAI